MHNTDAPLPDWPTCSHHIQESGKTCVGRQVGDFDHCLAHLTSDQLDRVLLRLHAGAELDVSGTPISAELLAKILGAVRGEDGLPAFGSVVFRSANFTEVADFDGVQFTRDACFRGAQFTGGASFSRAAFEGSVRFGSARFTGEAVFFWAKFMDDADFDGTQFMASAFFDFTRFKGETSFSMAQFLAEASFGGSRFEAYYATFVKARFEAEASFLGAYLTEANFTETEFESDALFDEAELLGGVKFKAARFGGSSVSTERSSGSPASRRRILRRRSGSAPSLPTG